MSKNEIAIRLRAGDAPPVEGAHEIDRLISEHSRRVTELLEANTREVERRRAAEAQRDGEREAREKLEGAYRSQDRAMGVLFERLNRAGVDCSDLIP